MKKANHLMLAALMLAIFLPASYTQAHDSHQRRVISTSGHGEVKVKPDMAVLHLSVRATHKSGKDAKQDVDDRINNFLDTLQGLKIKKKDIVASSLRIYPRYEHYSGNRQFKGYEASRTMTVTLRELKALTDVMDKALEQRLEGVDNIRYDHSNADKYRSEAHTLAITNSKTKAEALAKAYDAELGPIITINYHNNAPIYASKQSDMMMEASTLRAAPARPGTYIADELVFSDSIQVTFDLIVSE